jgi:hypothetical protein
MSLIISSLAGLAIDIRAGMESARSNNSADDEDELDKRILESIKSEYTEFEYYGEDGVQDMIQVARKLARVPLSRYCLCTFHGIWRDSIAFILEEHQS